MKNDENSELKTWHEIPWFLKKPTWDQRTVHNNYDSDIDEAHAINYFEHSCVAP